MFPKSVLTHPPPLPHNNNKKKPRWSGGGHLLEGRRLSQILTTERNTYLRRARIEGFNVYTENAPMQTRTSIYR